MYTENSRDNRIVPERVRLRAEQSSVQTRQWLKRLPHLIAELEQAWGIHMGQALAGGSSAYVAPVQTGHGHAVIKIVMPYDNGPGGFQREADILLRAGGHGYVRVLQCDDKRHTLLLEPLGHSMQELELEPQQTMKLLCGLLQQVWQLPAPAHLTITAAEHKAHTLAQLISELWSRLERPCPENIITQALTYAERRMAAFDPQQCVVVHGDPHPANALQVLSPRIGAETGYVFVDPESFLCEPEYDLGVVLRDWNTELLASSHPLTLAHDYCALLAQETGLAETAIWEWGFMERVSTGLYLCAYGSYEHGQPFFTTAQHLLDP